jgi:beta-xylosidase
MTTKIEYHNPVVPGFAPDPSLIYVESEDTYFLVNSSFHLFPGLPIYASKSLREFVHIGKLLGYQFAQLLTFPSRKCNQ